MPPPDDRSLGAIPVYVDIDPLTYNLNPALLEAAITSNTKAIVPVSLYGQPADFRSINVIAERHGLPVIEDGAQSFGSTQNGRRSCSLSTIATTSFFPSKPLGGYGDGGACFTDDADLAERMRRISRHGQSRRYFHSELGVNGRIDTLQAAIVLAKFQFFEQEVMARQYVADRYNRLLSKVGITTTPYLSPGNTSVYAQYTIQVHERSAVQEHLRQRGCLLQFTIPPCCVNNQRLLDAVRSVVLAAPHQMHNPRAKRCLACRCILISLPRTKTWL